MMKSILLFLSLCSYYNFCIGQSKSWILSSSEYKFFIHSTLVDNEDQLIAGQIYLNDWTREGFFLSKISPKGQEIWSKKVKFDNLTNQANIVGLRKYNDKIYLFGNTSFGNNAAFVFIYNAKTGKIIKKLGIEAFKNFGILLSLDVLNDNTMILSGKSSLNDNLIIAKIDENGQKVWANEIVVSNDRIYDDVKCIVNSNLDLLVIGYYKSINTTDTKETHIFRLGLIQGNVVTSKKITYKEGFKVEGVTVDNVKNLYIAGYFEYALRKNPFIIQLNSNLEMIEGEAFLAKNGNNYSFCNINLSMGQKFVLVAELPGTVEHEKLGVAQITTSEVKYNPHIPYIFNGSNNYFTINQNNELFVSGQNGTTLGVGGVIKLNKPDSITGCKNEEIVFLQDKITPNIDDYAVVKKDVQFLTQQDSFNELDINLKIEENCQQCAENINQNINASICEGKTFTYKNKTYSKAGVYRDTVKFLNCSGNVTINLKTNPTKHATISKSFCNNNPNIKIGTKTYTMAGTYQDTIKSKSANGCDSILTIHIKDLSDLSVDLGNDQEIIEGDRINLSAKSNHADLITQYTWLPQGTAAACTDCPTISVSPNKDQHYSVEVLTSSGCRATDSVLIKVLKKQLVYIPNIFSPNEDNINDLFRVYCAEAVEEVLDFSVYDRWGNHIFGLKNFAPEDDTKGWSGNYKNEPANIGIYTYHVTVRLRNGKQQEYKGDVLLQR